MNTDDVLEWYRRAKAQSQGSASYIIYTSNKGHVQVTVEELDLQPDDEARRALLEAKLA